MTIHREGFSIIAGTLIVFAAAIAALSYTLGLDSIWSWILLSPLIVIVYLIIQFFRLPKRINRSAENEIVAPCDGKVVVIEEVEEPEYFKGKRLQLSIFMSPLNVHANWVPFEGKVTYVRYHPGKYLVAWHPKSSTENERSSIVIERNANQNVLVRQVAGAVARRIKYYLETNQQVSRNQELGFIKFGSRVDLYLPLDTVVHCKIGDITNGNETVLASWK
jgi:phosphatidylserine decarboxylase